MDQNTNEERSATVKKVVSVVAFIMAMALILSIPVAAWFMTQRMLAVYAPISSPQSLYIGAGHIHYADPSDPDDVDEYEEIRYLYLDSIDADEFTPAEVESHLDYYDFVFCIYGKGVGGYKIQLAYTTNNQFTYQIFNATERDQAYYNGLTSEQKKAYVSYTTHGSSADTYYYTATGAAIAGTFLNQDGVNILANSTKHADTYGSYNRVNPYAEPLYWQTTNSLPGSMRGSFVNYYILRVSLNGKRTNDRETDVICIAAKSFAYEQE